MTYSAAQTARTARERLGQALAALQQHSDIPEDVMAVASNIAQSIGALFEAERASSELDGRASVKNALGTLGQTLALLQDVPAQYKQRLEPAVEAIAASMSALYPLAHAPSMPPAQSAYAATAVGHIPPHAPVPKEAHVAAAAPAPSPSQYSYQAPVSEQAAPAAAPYVAPAAAAPAPAALQPAPAPAPEPEPVARTRTSGPPPAPTPAGARASVDANIAATTESNFFVGFSGEISEGGVFLATYDVLAVRSSVEVLVTLPGGYEFKVNGWVRYVRDPFDFSADSDPGKGIQFENLQAKDRELIMRFIRKRAPTFYDD